MDETNKKALNASHSIDEPSLSTVSIFIDLTLNGDIVWLNALSLINRFDASTVFKFEISLFSCSICDFFSQISCFSK